MGGRCLVWENAVQFDIEGVGRCCRLQGGSMSVPVPPRIDPMDRYS
jgi:hypothetical protein